MHFVLIGGRSTVTIENIVKKRITKATVDKFSTVYSFMDDLQSVPTSTGRIILLEDGLNKEIYRQNITDFVAITTNKFPATRVFIIVSNLDFGKSIQQDIFSPYVVVVYMAKPKISKLFDVLTLPIEEIKETMGIDSFQDEEGVEEDAYTVTQLPNPANEETTTQGTDKKQKQGLFARLGKKKQKPVKQEEVPIQQEDTSLGGFDSSAYRETNDEGIPNSEEMEKIQKEESQGFTFVAEEQEQEEDGEPEYNVTVQERVQEIEEERVLQDEEEPLQQVEPILETVEVQEEDEEDEFPEIKEPEWEIPQQPQGFTFEEPYEETIEPENVVQIEEQVGAFETHEEEINQEPVSTTDDVDDGVVVEVEDFDEKEYRRKLEEQNNLVMTVEQIEDPLNNQNLELQSVVIGDEEEFNYSDLPQPAVKQQEATVPNEEDLKPTNQEGVTYTSPFNNQDTENEEHDNTVYTTEPESKLESASMVEVSVPVLEGASIDENIENLNIEQRPKQVVVKPKKGALGSNIIIVTGDRHSGVTSTALQIARMQAKRKDVLFVDFDVNRKGSLTWLGLEEVVSEISDQPAGSGVKHFKNPNTLQNLTYFVNNFNMHALITEHGVEVSDAELSLAQKALSVQKRYSTVIVDCPLDKMHLMGELIPYSTVVVTCVPQLRSCLTTISELSRAQETMHDRVAFNFFKNALYVITGNADFNSFDKNMDYIRTLFSLDEDTFDWTALRVLGSNANYKDWYMMI